MNNNERKKQNFVNKYGNEPEYIDGVSVAPTTPMDSEIPSCLDPESNKPTWQGHEMLPRSKPVFGYDAYNSGD